MSVNHWIVLLSNNRLQYLMQTTMPGTLPRPVKSEELKDLNVCTGFQALGIIEIQSQHQVFLLQPLTTPFFLLPAA